MMSIMAMAAAFSAAQGIPATSASSESPLEIANATMFKLTFSGGRVTGCTITATSGSPHVDRYVCDAARLCGDRYANAARRDGCIAKKREELAALIAKNSRAK